MIIKKNGGCAERKGEYERKRATEMDFCLNHCPHPRASDCRWTPRECMEQAQRRAERV